MTQATITVLGCGNSTGVPAIGNYWGACDPEESKNNRSRSSIAFQTDKTTLIVDTGPNFREQINRENIEKIDGVLYTHAHSDHINGIDELRVIHFRNKALVPIYGNAETLRDLKRRFDYLFDGGLIELYPPVLEPTEFKDADFSTIQTFKDIKFTPFIQDHGSIESVGYRFGDFAYSVDMHNLDDKAIETLKGIRTWIVDCAGYHQADNKVHANIEQIYKFNEHIGAENVYLSSLSLSMDYETLNKELKAGYAAAYDGLKFECTF